MKTFFGTDPNALADRLQDEMNNQPLTEMRLIDANRLTETINTLRALAATPGVREALERFAKRADDHAPYARDDTTVHFRLRDCRAARDALTQCGEPAATPASKFSPGEAVEVRNQNNAIDEIIIRRGDVHIEQMSADSWFMGVDASDGSYWQFWFGAKNRKSHVEFRHTETVSAAEQAPVNLPFERLPQHAGDPGFGPVPNVVPLGSDDPNHPSNIPEGET